MEVHKCSDFCLVQGCRLSTLDSYWHTVGI